VETSPERRIAYIVDDESEIRVALSLELRAAGIDSRPFASGQDFLDEVAHLRPGCLLLDVRMPGKNGIELLADLAVLNIRWPAVMMTGHAEVITAVEAMKLGAVEFLEKPFAEEALLAALERGFSVLEAQLGKSQARRTARAKWEKLTPREKEVFGGIAGGKSNRAIASQLDLSLRTVEMHRANLMKKLGVTNLADILSLAAEVGVDPAARPRTSAS